MLHFFLLSNNVLLYGYTTFIYPFVSWWTFGFFALLAITNNAATNIHVEVFVGMYLFSSLLLGVELLGPVIVPCVTFWSDNHLVVSDSLRPHGVYGLWNSPGQNTGVGRLSLPQGIFPILVSNPGLPRCRSILYQLSHKGGPITFWAAARLFLKWLHHFIFPLEMYEWSNFSTSLPTLIMSFWL